MCMYIYIYIYIHIHIAGYGSGKGGRGVQALQHLGGRAAFGLFHQDICVYIYANTSACSVRFGSLRFRVRFRPVPELNGSVRFGRFGSVRFLTSCYGELRHFCDDPDCPNPIWKLSVSGVQQNKHNNNNHHNDNDNDIKQVMQPTTLQHQTYIYIYIHTHMYIS